MDLGLDGYLILIQDADLLSNFSKLLGLPPASHPLEDRYQIADELVMRGTHRLLNTLQASYLKDLCGEMNLPSHLTKSEMIDKILQKIFHLCPPAEETNEPPPKTGKRKRAISESQVTSFAPKLKKTHTEIPLEDGTIPGKEVWPLSRLVPGLNSDTIHSHFNAEDLKQFCRENQIKVVGKKSKIISKILEFFATKQ